MNKKSSIITLLLGLSAFISALAQTNLNFENTSSPLEEWKISGNGNYKAGIDSLHSQEGKYSAYIFGSDTIKDGFKALGAHIPAKYEGEIVTLTGYIKTENVRDGYAGLWLKIDPQVSFDNMDGRGVTGTTEWNKFSISLPLKPKEATKIAFGGLLTGKGKMWVDNLKLTIDGNELKNVPEYQPTKAELDKEFNDGSKITFSSINSQEIENLALLGKVWGFLKYHHPVIASGEYNWDYELFRILEKVRKSKNDKLRDIILLDWINSFGKIPNNSPKEDNRDIAEKPDQKWIQDEIISTALRNKILEIYNHRISPSDTYYIKYSSEGAGNPNFEIEEAYQEISYPDTGYRLLGLFRYWNIIQYFFPYRNITDKDWNTILTEYIPEFVQTENELDYENTFLKVIAEVKDTHANLGGNIDKIKAQLGEYYPPFHVRFIEDQLVIDDIFNPEMADELPVKVGDIITKIEGKPVSEIVQKRVPFTPASNQPTRLRNISFFILRDSMPSKKLEIKNNNRISEVKIPLFKPTNLNIYFFFKQDFNQKSYKILEDNIGYINLGIIKQKDIPKIKKELKDTKGIIVDIRNYPNVFTVFSLGNYLVPQKKHFVKFTHMNLNNPGEFDFNMGPKVGTNKSNAYQGKVILLVDERTQSQAEYTAMAFKASPNTTVIGSTTAGADGNYSSIVLPGGLSTGISGIGIFYPDGTPTQRVGIIPDIEMTPTVKGIRNGEDELLERAIEIINN